MHCSGCDRDYPLCLFSAAQRQVLPEKRICIGREGHVRLCQHKTVKLSTVQRVVPWIRYLWRKLRIPGSYKFVCYHRSHMPKHYKFHWPRTRTNFPSMAIGIINEYGTIAASIAHTVHLDLSQHGNNPLTAEELRGHIKELRKNPETLIGPESYLGASMEMRCFDPNRCGCLLYSGTDNVRQRGCVEHEASRTLFSRVSDDDTAKVKFASCKYGEQCLAVTYSRTIQLDHGSRPWGQKLRGNLCRGSNCNPAWIKFRAEVENTTGTIPYGWFQALDPESYRLAEDQEAYGISWCRGKGCFNSICYGYLRDNLIQGQKISPYCSEGCLSDLSWKENRSSQKTPVREARWRENSFQLKGRISWHDPPVPGFS